VYVNGGKFDYPDNWWRNAESMKQWISSFLPTNVEALNEERLIELMEVEQKMPVVIDYYANWCSHCHQFAPVFDQASRVCLIY
jgi:thiol-disulfide isomerase/thioredoxin